MLKNIDLSKNIKKLGCGIFTRCEKLLSIKIPKKLKMIPADFCRGCVSIEEIYIPDNIKIIGKLAFFGCAKLRDVRLSNRMTIISHHAFTYCYALELIIIPKSVIGIDIGAFCNCQNLRNVVFKNANTLYETSAFDNCIRQLLKKPYRVGKFKNLKKLTDFNEDVCPITRETMTNKSVVVLLKCGHIFMETAFAEWEKRENYCPYCRSVIS